MDLFVDLLLGEWSTRPEAKRLGGFPGHVQEFSGKILQKIYENPENLIFRRFS